MTAPTRPSSTSKLAFHPHRIVISAGSMLALGSMSLPYVRLASTERGALALDTLPVLLLLVPIVAVTMVPDHSSAIPRPAGLVAAALALLAVPLAVVKLIDSIVLAESLEGTVGPGPWALLGGSLTVAAGVLLGLLRPDATHVRTVTAPVADQRPSGTRRVASRLDENPFGEPLFDSLEIVAPVTTPPDAYPQADDERPLTPAPSRALRQSEREWRSSQRPASSLAFDAEPAANRVADEGGDTLEA